MVRNNFKFFLICILVFFCHFAKAELSFYTTKSHLFLGDQVSDRMAWVKISDAPQLNEIEVNELTKFLKSKIKTNSIEKIKETANPAGFISFAKLKELGVTAKFEFESQKVLLQIDPALFESQKVYLSTKFHNHENVVTPNLFSGYLNVRGKRQWEFKELTVGSESDAFDSAKLESNFRLGSVVLENIGQYDEYYSGDQRFFREKSRLIIDLKKSHSRLTIGDLDSFSTGFQTVNSGAGLSYSKAYMVNPTYFRSMFRRSSLTIKERTFVEIFVNGQVVERINAMPGVLDLLDYPFLNGTNNVEIAMTDAFGEKRRLFFNAAFDYRLLPVGLNEYNFNLQWNRSIDDPRSESYDLENWNLTGFYRQGLYKNLALGANIQATENYQLYGAEGVYTTQTGIFEWDLGYSSDSNLNKNGIALKSTYQSFFAQDGKRADIRYQLGLNHFAPGFSYFDSLLNSTNYEWVASASISQNYISKISAGVGLTRSWSSFQTTLDDRTDFTTTVGCNLGGNFLLSANIKANINRFDDYTAMFNLSWYEPQSFQQLTSSYYPKEKVSSINYSAQPYRGQDNLRLSTGLDQREENRSVNAGVEFQNQRMELQALGGATFYDNTQTTQQNIQGAISFGTALAFAGSHVAISRPIQNSFTIVAIDKNTQGKDIAINKFGNYQNGEINAFGPAVINNMTPYFDTQVALDVKTLPMGYHLEQEKFTVQPGFKTGQVIEAKVKGEISIKGKLRFHYNRVGYLNVRLVSEKGKIYDFFANEQGEFFISGVEPGVYTLVLENYIVREKIKVNKNAIGIVDIGELYATEK